MPKFIQKVSEGLQFNASNKTFANWDRIICPRANAIKLDPKNFNLFNGHNISFQSNGPETINWANLTPHEKNSGRAFDAN